LIKTLMNVINKAITRGVTGRGYEIHFPLHHVNFLSSLLTPL
jgi:hypothetical protein